MVDISGVPKRDSSGNFETVILASTSVNVYKVEKLKEEFRNQFPGHWNKKGRQLSADKLEEIVAFLNQENVRMTTVHLDAEDWDTYKAKYKGEAHFEEKIMGILYFYVLKWVAWKGRLHPALLDYDSSFGIIQSITTCKNLARANDYHFDVSFGHIPVNPELRFPDWIASARKKIDLDSLKKYKHFKVLRNYLDRRYLLRVMKKVSL